MTTLRSLALQWVNDEITLDEATDSAKTIEWPVRRTENGESWHEGDEANLTSSVYSLIDSNQMTEKQVTSFLSAIAASINI